MAAERSSLQPGQLRERIQAQTAYALACGALQSIPTHYEFIEQQGIAFLVRVLANLARKEQAAQKQTQLAKTGQDFNPFLPYEEDLFVANLSETHLCLLNKYNVVDHHLLIVTRDFEEQEAWLNSQDFDALSTCMAEVDGLAFYNGGKIAGASQRHKHLQIVPVPLTPENARIPIESVICKSLSMRDAAAAIAPVHEISELPFVHAICRLDPDWFGNSREVAPQLLECYRQLLDAVGLKVDEAAPHRQSGAYNLLMTREWMLVVPRSQESYSSIPVNSLGFAGSLFVKNESQKQLLKEQGPLTVLTGVGVVRNKLAS